MLTEPMPRSARYTERDNQTGTATAVRTTPTMINITSLRYAARRDGAVPNSTPLVMQSTGIDRNPPILPLAMIFAQVASWNTPAGAWQVVQYGTA